jgi:hypothetical protein
VFESFIDAWNLNDDNSSADHGWTTNARAYSRAIKEPTGPGRSRQGVFAAPTVDFRSEYTASVRYSAALKLRSGDNFVAAGIGLVEIGMYSNMLIGAGKGRVWANNLVKAIRTLGDSTNTATVGSGALTGDGRGLSFFGNAYTTTFDQGTRLLIWNEYLEATRERFKRLGINLNFENHSFIFEEEEFV